MVGTYGEEIAKAGLEINAIKLSPDNPYLWASGYRMPIYNDNRMFMYFPGLRDLIIGGFEQLISDEGIQYEVIAGTSTSGIPWGAFLARELACPFVYIRDKPKDHGLKNQIEGIDAEKDLEGRKVVVIEDLISTGGSSANAVQAVRDANGEANWCLSIFDYGLDKAVEEFANLNPRCNIRSLLTYDTLLDIAKGIGYLTEEQIGMLQEWRADPFNWGEKHGFPKVERGGN